ncbi:30S ribosomal protein S1 [Meiothermus taiwanensis]|uniref:Small ribosomal subunit protein bS1 n=2 Tax=Meiothermus taiwanensis TaxID=172827 RepID=A0A399E0D3_9DEIN|nr:30S ribosomal protein S1 [Meiothermus taiwanensis]AWR85334.1 small subunit ribosomal protein S1 [Meiothermus taiwanensis WR-220]KIQ55802.1 30S ribosomal protein S1 [Meiothermus taiwanensis]KZK15881.1 30S ribosomal protein S1 [Meiothermus taiwanensis]RIH77556.1 30S ribosomal protein S1 [Meiothermus taiwanensis]
MEDQATQTPVETGKEPQAFSMEQALQDAEARLEKTVQRGQIVTGTVVFVTNDGVMVDIGARTEAVIPFNQLTEENLSEEELKNLLKPGDTVTAYVVRADLENGQVVLSKKRAEADQSWVKIQALYEQGEPVMVQVKEKVKGGLVATIEGLRAFLPASQVDLKRTPELDEYVGQSFLVKIIELNRKKGRIILSRRTVLEAEQKAARSRILASLKEGDIVEGQVVEVTDFGVFVALGGVDGLVHRSEITWGRFNHPKDVVQKGQTVKAKVLSVDTERERVNLSMKALSQDPWLTVSEKYPVGSRLIGKVVGLTQFGAFVEVEPGLEGLIHISELSWTKRPKHPGEILKEGQEVEAQVLRIDPEERRLSLGLKQTQPDPWKSLPDRYPPGTPVKGKVTGLTDFGVFVEIEPGIEGLIHVSELAYERVEKPSEIFKKGDEVEAAILQIDPVEQRISLSRKRLLPPPAHAVSIPGGEEGEGRKNRREGKEGERPKRSKSKGGAREGRSRDHDYEYGMGGGAASYTNYDPSVVATSNTNVKLGDVFGDLLSQLALEEDKDKEKA